MKDLDAIASEFKKTKGTVVRDGLNLYQTTATQAAVKFLRKIDLESKSKQQPFVTLVAVFSQSTED